jgi:hypothetical protein
MSWCDKLASTPGVGFGLDTHFVSSAEILSALAPVLDPLATDVGQRFNMEKHDVYSVAFSTFDGFQYLFDQWKCAVIFRHSMKTKVVSGQPPTMEMLSKPLPFTELLPTVSEKLVDAALLLPGPDTRRVKRVGVVSTTTVAEEDLPPGIDRFIKYVGRPWKSGLHTYQIQLTSDLERRSGSYDRCIHTLTKPEDREQLITVSFDWQRFFESGQPLTKHSLEQMLDRATGSALQYFEDLAEGGRFDESLIRDSVGV